MFKYLIAECQQLWLRTNVNLVEWAIALHGMYESALVFISIFKQRNLYIVGCAWCIWAYFHLSELKYYYKNKQINAIPSGLYLTLPHQFPWSPHGVLVESSQSSWSPHGVLMESSQSPQSPQGVHVESPWSLWGVLMESSWSPHRVHGVLIDSMETPWGLHEDSMRTPWGLREDFMRTPPKIHRFYGESMDFGWTMISLGEIYNS
jgi:hypothetical protein